MWDSNHLQKAHSGYFRHLFIAMWFNLLALTLLITGIIHALIPGLFPFTPYQLAKKIVRDTEAYFIRHDE